MDDTQQSRASDAAATRKRRSSILKSQRPARTPFSELEFNVATPTDTAKSRRVSFSRRTGVAEFVTNEATTTWKNFYEEHNKSLESSGNDSDANASRQPVGHLGKRLFDQQFEEVEAVDFIGNLNQINSNSLLNNVNFTDQLTSLDCAADGKLTAPQNNFELSAFTDQQSKLFGNDFTAPCNEMSGRIDVNFSAMQHITGNDDLDDIQRDIERQSNNIACPGPYNDRQNMSEYIEVDLNMTHVNMKNDDDMSITETVLSPKVQELSRNSSLIKKPSENNDWVMDKENIAINPYAATKESENFAINDEPDQVLVFDGKRLTVQSETAEKDNRQTLLPNASAETPQRKTIVLNVNDDLPNFIDDMLNSKCDNSEFSGMHELKSITTYDNNLSMTQPINRIEILPKRKTIHDNTGNISMTQALPTNILTNPNESEKADKHRTIMYEEESGNISVTQALPGNIMINNGERRRTVVYEDDTGNISITQAIPSNILDNGGNERRKTIVFDDDRGNISVTQAVSGNIILPENQPDKRKTIVFDDDGGNVSITQAVPNIVLSDRQLSDKRRTIIYEDKTGHVSVTQALPTIFTKIPERRRTVVYEDDSGNISVTQALTSNIIINNVDKPKENDSNEIVPSQLPTDIILKDTDSTRRKTILYEEDTGNISITQAVPTTVIEGICERRSYVISKETSTSCNEKNDNERRTTIYDDYCDISVTQAIPTNIILSDEGNRKTVEFDHDSSNISITQAVSSRVLLADKDSDTEISDATSNAQGSERSIVDNGNLDKIVEDNEILDVNLEPIASAASIDEVEADDISSNMPNSNATSGGSTPFSTSFTDRSDIEVEVADRKPEVAPKSATVDLTDKIPKVPSNAPLIDNLESVVDDNTQNSDNIKVNSKPIPGRVTLVDKFDSVKESEKAITKPTPGRVFRLEKYESMGDARVRMIEEIVEATEKVIDSHMYDQDVSMDEMPENRTLVIHTDKRDADMSYAQTIPKVQNLMQETDKRRTIMFDNDNGNISMTKPIPADLLAFQNDLLNKSRNKQLDSEQDQIANACPNVIVYQTVTHSAPKLSNKTEQGDNSSEVVITSSSIVKNEVEKIIDSRDSVQEDGSEVHSLVAHPPVEVRSDVMNLKPSSIDMDIDHSFNDVRGTQMSVESQEHPVIDQPKESVLSSLLDMTCSSVDCGTEDKKLTAKMSPKPSAPTVTTSTTDNSSSESMFYIRRDSDDAPTDSEPLEVRRSSTKTIRIKEKPAIINQSPLSSEYKDDDEPKFVDDLEKKLAELKSVVNDQKKVTLNKLYETLASTELEEIVERDENVKLRQQSISFKKANDTKELLDMISDFTDNNDDDDDELPVMIKERVASEVKNEATEPKRLSFAPNRQSIILSREDLLSNISMAQAALQKSRLEIDETDCADEGEETKDTTMDHSIHNILKKSGRMSNEVVKTLHFDDDTVSETSLKYDTKASPLKKTAFGETSYMTESKAKVIPTYLKDVSDGIKQLMLDLVKPMSVNTMPFEAGGQDRAVKKSPSTQSTQVQANLITSSQIDIDSDLNSNAEYGYDIDKMSSLTGSCPLKSRSRSFRSPVRFANTLSERSSELEVPLMQQRYATCPKSPDTHRVQSKVLVFDHQNPLNNILLGSRNYSDAHKYNPKRSDETLCGSKGERSIQSNFQNVIDDDYDLDNVTTQYHMETRLSLDIAMQGDMCAYKNEDEKSIMSNVSKPPSIDQSIDVKVMELTDTEVNTLITMKGNKELLEASSSLTLVDDPVVQVPSDKEVKNKSNLHDDDRNEYHKLKVSRSPVEIIYKIDENTTGAELIETSATSNEDIEHKKTKGKKRLYSPSADKYKPTHIEVTPKPNTKMQKISKSPNVYRVQLDLPITETNTKMAAEKDITDVNTEQKISREKRKSPKKTKEKEKKAGITVQQLITEYHIEAGLNQKILDKQILNALKETSDNSMAPTSQSDFDCKSIDVTSSFTSSNNLNSMKDICSSSTTHSQQSALHPSRMDWHPELKGGLSSNLYTSNSGVNVVAKIDMLPFMGSHECEWESSSADTWSFRLLHGRLRLTARLAHRHDNSTRTRVRGDTPVLDLFVETVQHDKKNPVATLCVRFACETMRYMVTKACRGSCCASDIPPLLRRCAAVARVALRWGRAMHDAKLHLAYTLDNEGYLTLKVANIPLRSVWEVRMRVELVVGDAREAPWPRAGDVRVSRVVSDFSVPDADVARVLAHTPRDWGHVPRTIWRMFRFLKNKTRDDDILLGA